MASIKLHVFRDVNSDNDGTENCDFRGDRFVGHEQGDEHRTVPQLEIDPAPEALIEKVLAFGPEVNSLLGDMLDLQPEAVQSLADALGLKGQGPVKLRFGVWDD